MEDKYDLAFPQYISVLLLLTMIQPEIRNLYEAYCTWTYQNFHFLLFSLQLDELLQITAFYMLTLKSPGMEEEFTISFL